MSRVAMLPLLLLRRILGTVLALINALGRLITCRLWRRQNRIGELPFVVVGGSSLSLSSDEEVHQQQQHLLNTPNTTDWVDNGWSAEPTSAVAVADQIAQYRRQREAEAAAAKKSTANSKKVPPLSERSQCQRAATTAPHEPMAPADDLFSELQPNVKAPKKLLLRPKNGTVPRNLFAVQPNDENGTYHFSIEQVDRLGALGDLADDDKLLDVVDGDAGGDSNWLDDQESAELSHQIDAAERAQRRLERRQRQQRLRHHNYQAQQQQLATSAAAAGANEHKSRTLMTMLGDDGTSPTAAGLLLQQHECRVQMG